MTTERRNEIKQDYYKILKNKYKPEAIEWINQQIFYLDMIDRWDIEERTKFDVLIEIKKEIME